MFNRYTERAQRTIVYAQDAARELGFDVVGTEHLLLGLLKDADSLAVKTLSALGKDAASLQARLLKLAGRGNVKQSREFVFSPRAKKVLVDLAVDEAKGLGHPHVGTEHLLLGLIREGEGLAAVALDQIGVDLTGARQAVAEAVGAGQTAPGAEPDQDSASAPERSGRVLSVIRRAQQEAARLGARRVSYEHLLMAILADPGAADLSDMLKVRGVTVEWLRDQYRQSYGEGESN